MPDSFHTLLSDRAVLRLTGKDCVKLLQGILTRDITKLSDSQALYALMLTPQGKFLYDFFLVKDGDAILLDIDAGKKADIQKKLALYKLRSDVTITETEMTVHALCGDEALKLLDSTAPGTAVNIPGGHRYIDPRTTGMFVRQLGREIPAGFPEGTLTDYDRIRIHHCVPDTRNDLVPEKFFPLFFRMDELNAIDFDKGCYVGQEVTTRSKHRGNIRRSIYTVHGKAPMPEPGTTITAEGKAVGELLSSFGDTAIALLEKEALEHKLMAGDMHLRVVQR